MLNAKTIPSFASKYSRILSFLLAFCFILAFRALYGFQVNTFGQDLARDLTLIEQRLEQGQLLVGYGPKASVGDFYLAPLYYQLHTILSLVSGNYVWIMKWWVIVIESLTPLLIYLLLRRLNISKKLSIGLSGIYVTAALPTIFGSFAWNPNTIPFFSTLALYLTIESLQQHKQRLLMWIPLLIAITMHLHYQAAVLLPFYGLLMIYTAFRDRSAIKYWLLGILLALLTIAPYLAAELRSNWLNTRAILDYFQSEHSRYYERVSKPAYVLTFLPSFFSRVLTGENHRWRWLGRAITFLGAVSWVSLIRPARKLKSKKLWLTLGLYFFFVVLMLRVYKGDKIDYYLSTLYILPIFLLAALSKVYKKAAVLLLLVSGFYLGRFYAQVQPVNQLQQLRATVNRVEHILAQQSRSSAAFLFHFDDHINSYVYGLDKFTDVKIDQQSNYLVEVCAVHQRCNSPVITQCKYSREWTFASLLKDQTQAETISSFRGADGSKIVVSQLEGQPQVSGYALRSTKMEAGFDYLRPELYFFN